MIEHGRVYVDGGYRPALVKYGRKWAEVLYIDGSSVGRKRVLIHNVGKVERMPGWEGKRFARFLVESGKHMTKRVQQVLREAGG